MTQLCPICNKPTTSTKNTQDCKLDMDNHYFTMIKSLGQWWWTFRKDNKIIRMANSNRITECYIKIQVGEDDTNIHEFPCKPMSPEESLPLALKKLNLIPFT
jgi:hypothetical protein